MNGLLPDGAWLDTFRAWYADAERAEPRVPDAMQVATVDPHGRPSVRTVLLKDADVDGFVFYTNTGSQKALELAVNPRVAAVLHWKSLERQVRIDGHAERVPDAVADAYWVTRPRGSQLGAWASRQSEVLDDRSTLVQRLDAVTARFDGEPVPRPPFWTGYCIEPDRIEFWQGRPDRLHDRIVFVAVPGGWLQRRLYP